MKPEERIRVEGKPDFIFLNNPSDEEELYQVLILDKE
jgi:hypothetical protein